MAKVLQILIVDDSASDAGLIARHIEHAGYKLSWIRVETAAELQAALDQHTWDIILCDHRMPDFTGIEALCLIRSRGCDIPLIFVSGTMGEDLAVEAMRSGAGDYVMKGDLKRLVPAIERELREAMIRREKRAAENLLAIRTNALEATANAVVIARRDGHIEWVNPAYTTLTGYSAAEAVASSSRLRLVDGNETPVNDERWVSLALGASWHGEGINHRKDGSSYLEEMTVTPVNGPDGEIVHFIAIKQDVSARKRAQDSLQRRERILKALGVAAEHFLSASGWHEKVTTVLERLGHAADVNRVVIWETHPGPAGAALISQRYEWGGAGMASRVDDPSVQNLPLVAGGFGRWGEVLGRGEVLQGHVRDFPACEQPALIHHQIISIAVVPILVAGQWWGFMAFDECRQERLWQQNEIDALQAAARILGEAIERERMDAALRASEERLRLALVAAQQGLFDLNLATGEAVVNPEYAMMLGYDPTKLQGNVATWIDRMHPEDLARAEQVLQNCLTGRNAEYRIEYRQRTKSGRWKWILSVGRVVEHAPDGKPRRMLGTHTDITERKHAEETVRRQYALLDALINSPSDLLIFSLDRNSCYTAFNERHRHEMRRVWRTEIEIGRSVLDCMTDPAARELARQSIDRALQGEIFTEIQHQADRDVFYELVWNPIHQTDGKIIGVTAFIRDVTERIRADTALRESEERFRAIFESSLDGFIMGTPDGAILAANPAACAMFGQTEAEICRLGRNPHLATDDPRLAAFIAERERTGRVRGELTMIRGDGTRFETEISSAIFRSGTTQRVSLVIRDVTERKRTEERLRKLSRIIEQAPLSVVITDLTGVIEYVNPAFCAITGYSADEVRGRNPRFLKSGRTPPEVYQDMWQTLTRGEVWSGNLQNRKKNGDLYAETAVIAPVVDDQARATHYVALKEDVTARQRTESALQEIQERYKLIAENSDDVIWLYDLNADQFSYCSPSVKRLRGFEVEEVIGQRMAQVLTPASADRVARDFPGRLARFVAGDPEAKTSVSEVDQFRRDGTIVPTEVVTTLLRADDGQGIRLLGVSRDITERVKARETLLRFNAELETQVSQRTAEAAARNREVHGLLQAIPDMIVRLRTDGTVLHCQPAHGSDRLAAIVHREGGHGPCQPDREIVAHSASLGRRALAENTTVTTEAELAHASGKIEIELRAAPSGPDEFVVFVRDIAARRRLEAETQAMLEREHEASEMKTRFISMTSHEFRTPMATVMGSAEILSNHLDRLTPGKRQELFERINSSLLRMTEMLDDVLTLNRMDAKRSDVQPVSIDLLNFLTNAIDEIRRGDRDSHTFVLHASGDAVPFVTDPKLLHHIFANLLSNAARYSPAGTPVTVQLSVEAGGVRVRVEDQGIGIPPEDRLRIFEPFERGTNVGNIKGTGLGLNIVKRMTDSLGGTIAVECPAGGGSRFTLELPSLSSPPSLP